MDVDPPATPEATMSTVAPHASPLARTAVRAARWSATHPWWAIGGWFALVVACTSLLVLVPQQQIGEAGHRVGESGLAATWTDEARLADPDAELVLLTAGPGTGPDAVLAGARDLTDALAGRPDVAGVGAPAPSPDGSSVLVVVELADGVAEVTELQSAVGEVAERHPGLVVEQSGEVSVQDAIDARVAEDLVSAEIVSLPVTLLLMLLAFGAVVAAGLPVLLAVSSVAATLGVSAVLSHLVPADPTVSSMVVLIGMAVGVDYTLFYLKREREERARGRSTADAVEIAAQTSGHAVVVSGLAVVVSLSALYLLQLATFTSLATGAVAVVAVSVVGSVTVLPALLVVLGHRADRPRVPLLWRLQRRLGPGAVSRRVLGPAVHHPLAAVLVVGVACLAAAAPALGMRLHGADTGTLPQDIPEVRTLVRVAEQFPERGETLDVVVRGDASQAPQVEAALRGLDRTAVGTGRFTDLGTPAVVAADDGRTHVLTLAVPLEGTDPALDDVVRDLRADLVPAALDGLDVEAAVGGWPAAELDRTQRQTERMPWVVGAVLLLTCLTMVVSFRSVPVALVSTGLNLLSVGIAFGVLRMVFQEGWLAGALDVAAPGFVVDWVPLFVMVVLVGLSMDYHVFVLSRVRERVLRGVEPRTAVRYGIADSAGTVTSAAAVMVSVFAIFATLSMVEMKMLGVALAVAILVDATVVRLVLLPGILTLLGERAWGRARPGPPAPSAPTLEPAGATP